MKWCPCAKHRDCLPKVNILTTFGRALEFIVECDGNVQMEGVRLRKTDRRKLRKKERNKERKEGTKKERKEERQKGRKRNEGRKKDRKKGRREERTR